MLPALSTIISVYIIFRCIERMTQAIPVKESSLGIKIILGSIVIISAIVVMTIVISQLNIIYKIATMMGDGLSTDIYEDPFPSPIPGVPGY